MSKGRALRLVGGALLAFGLFSLFATDGPVQRDIMLIAVGSALSIFGMSA